LTSVEIKLFKRTAKYTLFDLKSKKAILEELKVEPVDERIRYKSNWQRHVTRINNNRMPKNNAELQTKWMKTSWKTFGETIRRGRNRSIKA
jgi:hypothetical protein